MDRTCKNNKQFLFLILPLLTLIIFIPVKRVTGAVSGQDDGAAVRVASGTITPPGEDKRAECGNCYHTVIRENHRLLKKKELPQDSSNSEAVIPTGTYTGTTTLPNLFDQGEDAHYWKGTDLENSIVVIVSEDGTVTGDLRWRRIGIPYSSDSCLHTNNISYQGTLHGTLSDVSGEIGIELLGVVSHMVEGDPEYCSIPDYDIEANGEFTVTIIMHGNTMYGDAPGVFTYTAHQETHPETTPETTPDAAAVATEIAYWASQEPGTWVTEEAYHHYEDRTPAILSTELYQELTDYLAGEGITAPTPGQIGASGAALATLLAGWLILNQISGVSAQTSLEVIDAWSHNQPPPEPPESTLQEQPVEPEQEPPSGQSEQPEELPGEPEQDLPSGQQAEQTEEQPDEQGREPATLQPPDSVPEQDALQPPGPPQDTGPLAEHPEPKPPLPGAEDQALQEIRDIQDLDDAVKNTRRDFEAFYNNVPESIRNSDIWRNNVQSRFEQIRDMIARGELDTSRAWLDRAEQLLELRNEIDRDLNHLPDDSREAILWTERTLRTLGHIASDTYQSLVIDPAKNAGNAVLPSELAERWNGAMDELNQDLSDVAQDISRLPRQGAEMLTHRNLQQQAQEMLQSSEQGSQDMGQEIQELYGDRDVPVEYPDFMGRGTRKVQELWDHTMNSLFGGN